MFYFLGWFGMRKDFCQFLLSVFPLLQEYANIAYNNDNNQQSGLNPRGASNPTAGDGPQNPNSVDQFRENRNTRSKEKLCKKSSKNQKKNELLKPVVPIISIDIPDWTDFIHYGNLSIVKQWSLLPVTNARKLPSDPKMTNQR